MDKKVILALDAMGGDNAPAQIVLGAVNALTQNEKLFIKLVGQSSVIEAELADKQYDSSRLEIVNADEIIETGEPPVAAIRHKKDSSMVKGLELVRDGLADGFITAGSSGATLVGGQLIVGRLKGVDRAPIGAIIPTVGRPSVVIDSGANMDCNPKQLRAFAIMGSIYMSIAMGIESPRVGLINVGVEEDKGNLVTKETFKLLSETPNINFIGNVEAREVPNGAADVLVCDAFVGNVILKLYEGTAGALIGLIKKSFYSSLKSKIGALLVKKSLKSALKGLSASEYGGAPLLGLKGLVVKTHGNATAKEVCNTLLQCIGFVEDDIIEKIKSGLEADESKEE